jgi:predicted Zn-dependent protease
MRDVLGLPAHPSLTLRTHPLTRTRLRSTSLADALAHEGGHQRTKPVAWASYAQHPAPLSVSAPGYLAGCRRASEGIRHT